MNVKDMIGVFAAALIVIGVIVVMFEAIDRRLTGGGDTVEKDIAVVAAMEKQNLELIETVKDLAKRRAGISDQTLVILAIVSGVVFIIALKIMTAFRIRRDEIRYGITAPDARQAIGYDPGYQSSDYMIDYNYSNRY